MIRRAKFWLWAACGAMTAGTAGLLALAILRPVGPPRLAAPGPATAPTDADVTGGLPSLAEFSEVWSMDLRRPLYDPPPTTRQTTPPAAEALSVKLAGTVVEPGHSRAIFITAGGLTELKAIGDTTGNAEILAIDETSATLLYRGKRVTLETPIKDDL